jgi:hypothetical protein
VKALNNGVDTRSMVESYCAALMRDLYTTGMEHSPTSATGTGWERTPWHATRGAVELSPELYQTLMRRFTLPGHRARRVRTA